MGIEKIPEVVECYGCGRTLGPQIYRATPTADTPPVMVTRVFNPTHPYLSVQCANCAHYTVFTPWDPEK